MRQVVRLLVGVALVAAPVFVAASPVHAASAAHSSRFVGSYRMVLDESGELFKSTLTVHADGTCDDTSHDELPLACTWSNAGSQFTLVANEVSVHLVGTRTPKGIGNKRHPGAAYNGESQYATWYAIKKS